MSVTIADWLTQARAQLRDRSEVPAREAVWLLAHVTGLDESAQRQHARQTLSAAQHQQLDALLARRTHGEPLAYVLGTQPFWTLELAVTAEVLIPRADTEVLVTQALRYLPPHASCRVADLGTGSGAIALALAHERPQAEMWATDISAAALQVATRNAHKLGLAVQFRQGSWCDALPDLPFEVIVSNPPYIAAGDPHLDAAVRDHEPQLALIAGDDGLAALRTVIETAPSHLTHQGHLLLEHGWQQAEKVKMLLESAGFVDVASHADLAGHLRVTEGTWIQVTRQSCLS